MYLLINNSEEERFRKMDGVERSFIETLIHEKAREIGREYLTSPTVLKTLQIEDRLKDGFEIIISIYNRLQRRKEKYAVNVSAIRLSLNSYEPSKWPIINLR